MNTNIVINSETTQNYQGESNLVKETKVNNLVDFFKNVQGTIINVNDDYSPNVYSEETSENNSEKFSKIPIPNPVNDLAESSDQLPLELNMESLGEAYQQEEQKLIEKNSSLKNNELNELNLKMLVAKGLQDKGFGEEAIIKYLYEMKSSKETKQPIEIYEEISKLGFESCKVNQFFLQKYEKVEEVVNYVKNKENNLNSPKITSDNNLFGDSDSSGEEDSNNIVNSNIINNRKEIKNNQCEDELEEMHLIKEPEQTIRKTKAAFGAVFSFVGLAGSGVGGYFLATAGVGATIATGGVFGLFVMALTCFFLLLYFIDQFKNGSETTQIEQKNNNKIENSNQEFHLKNKIKTNKENEVEVNSQLNNENQASSKSDLEEKK